jgi:hypothetical protein
LGDGSLAQHASQDCQKAWPQRTDFSQLPSAVISNVDQPLGSPSQGYNKEEEKRISIEADAVSNAPEQRTIGQQGMLEDIEHTEHAEDMRALYEQAFAILQPAFDENIISEEAMRDLVSIDDEHPFDFIVSLLLLYKRERCSTLGLIRKAICEGDSLTQLNAEVSFHDARDLVHRMRGGALNLGDAVLAEACSNMRGICLAKDLEALANGPGHFHDLVQASLVSAPHFKRFLKFIKTRMPECFGSTDELSD